MKSSAWKGSRSEGRYLLRTQGERLDPARAVARLRATHRNRFSRPQIGLIDPAGMAPARATCWCTPRVLSSLGVGEDSELWEISLADVVLPTRNGLEIRKHRISQPNRAPNGFGCNGSA
jgi:hypothetical protein